MAKNSEKLAEMLRQQIVKALATGLWEPGAKLPSIRDMAAAMNLDPRVVSGAYRELSIEGLLDLKSRSGAYISEAARPTGAAVVPSVAWITDMLVDGVAREVRLTDVAEWLRRATETLRLKAFVIAPTHDQVDGLRREVFTYYGIDTGGRILNDVERARDLPLELRRADLLITTEACRKVSSQISAALDLPCICVSGRMDLAGPHWQSLMQSPGYVVVTDESFGAIFQSFVAAQGSTSKVTVLVVGSDDLGVIPADGVVYVTQSAREKLGSLALNGRILPSVRVLSRESSHELTAFIVERNLAAVKSRQGIAGAPGLDRAGLASNRRHATARKMRLQSGVDDGD